MLYCPVQLFFSCSRHEDLLDKGGLYADMWLKQQQAHDAGDSASDTETKDQQTEKLQPITSHRGH